jgi:hypothetical protein
VLQVQGESGQPGAGAERRPDDLVEGDRHRPAQGDPHGVAV